MSPSHKPFCNTQNTNTYTTHAIHIQYSKYVRTIQVQLLLMLARHIRKYVWKYIIMHAVFVVSKAEFASDTVTCSNDLIQLSWARVTGLQTTAEIRQNALHNACPPPHTTYMFPLSILLPLPFILASFLSPSLPSAGRLCESCSWI